MKLDTAAARQRQQQPPQSLNDPNSYGWTTGVGLPSPPDVSLLVDGGGGGVGHNLSLARPPAKLLRHSRRANTQRALTHSLHSRLSPLTSAAPKPKVQLATAAANMRTAPILRRFRPLISQSQRKSGDRHRSLSRPTDAESATETEAALSRDRRWKAARPLLHWAGGRTRFPGRPRANAAGAAGN